ncbi:MAG: hypothetical protein WCO00_16985 [Rhodospirillaceae bacterium]
MILRLTRLFAVLATTVALASPLGAAARSGDEKSVEPASPLGDWRIGPVVTKDGAFAYCMAESRFDNGWSLVIARSRQGALNIGLGMAAAHLIKGAAWPVTVIVDGSFKRDRQAVAADPDMLVIANKGDTELFQALVHGDTLAIRGPKDTISFQLRGTNRAMPALRTCVEQARAGKPANPLGSVAAGSLQFPPALKRLLAEAGFKTVGLMAASAAPQGLGPVDFLWKAAEVTAGMAESRTTLGAGLAGLGDAILERLRPRCAGGFTASESDATTLPGGSFRALEVACTTSAGTTSHIAFLFELGRGGLFKQFFFEAADAAAAARDRDMIAGVLKQAESR